MNFVDYLPPIIYTALFGLAILFLLRIKNTKFYSKILFVVLVVSVALWGWGEFLLQHVGSSDAVFIFSYIAFAFGFAACVSFLLIACSIAGISFHPRQYWYFYVALAVLFCLNFVPGFIISGFRSLPTHINITEGFGDYLYSTEIVLIIVSALVVFGVTYAKTEKFSRYKLNSVLVGIVLTAVCGVVGNVLLPAVFENESYTYIAPLASVFLVLGIANSVIRWNLLGMYFKSKVSHSYASIFWRDHGSDFRKGVQAAAEKIGRSTALHSTTYHLLFPGVLVRQGGPAFIHPLVYRLIVYAIKRARFFFPKYIQFFQEGNLEVIFIYSQNFTLSSQEMANIVQEFRAVFFYKDAVESTMDMHVKENNLRSIV